MASPSAPPPTPRTESPVLESAPAKINLDLLVTGRRPDGYHEIDSLVAFARPGDVLTLAPAERLEVLVEGPFAQALRDSPDNLVHRAALALAEAAGVDARARIVLDKRLPVAAGLGGGSADAAATLRGLDRLLGLGAAPEDLERIGAGLGADVPVCVRSRPARMRGRGEALDPLPPLPALPLLLVHGGRALATRDVFAARTGAFSPPRERLDLSLDALRESRNDLLPAARALMPELDGQLRTLATLPRCTLARMSGSGAALFALFEDGVSRDDAATTLAATHPRWWVQPAELGEHP
jgi:4-diphosphocytidyl-2-C-methyl-D-erythritol kinase